MSDVEDQKQDEEYEEETGEETGEEKADGSNDGEGEKEEIEEEEGDGEGGEEDEEEDDDEGNKLSEYVTQHGAHREYGVPNKFIKFEAKKPMSVLGGEHIGNMLASRSGKAWEGLMHFHVTLMGGHSKTSGKSEVAPYVCFKPPGDTEESDDSIWLRSIPAKVIEYHQPLWRAAIKERFKADKEKRTRFLAFYKPVLEWTPEQFTGPKLNPESLGVGKKDFRLLTKKLKSLRINPEPVPRGGAKQAAEEAKPKAKMSSAISKGAPKAKGAASSSSIATMDASESSEMEVVVDAKVVRIGDVGKVKTFESAGGVFATIFA